MNDTSTAKEAPLNIDNLTIGDAKKLAAMFGQQAQFSSDCPLIGQKVIVRARDAGVHYGLLVSLDGTTVVLHDARRLWYWQVKDKAGISLSDVAKHGVSSSSKICEVVPVQVVLSVCEIMQTSEECQKTIEVANAYRP